MYPGSSEYDQIRYICQTQGSPPEQMLRAATKTSRFFNRDESCSNGLMGHHSYPFWRLKTPDEHEAETSTKSKEARKYIFNCLEDMAQINVPNDLEGVELIAEKLDRRAFVSILKDMLQLDQERRIDPDSALKHTFVTMNHLVDYGHLNSVRMSFQMMEVCNKKRLNPSASQQLSLLHSSHAANMLSQQSVHAQQQHQQQQSHHNHQQQQQQPQQQTDSLLSNFMPQSVNTSSSLHHHNAANGARDLSYAVPCHLQNMAATAPYFAAAAAARHQQMSLFPSYHQDTSSLLSSQTAAAAAAMLSLQQPTLPFHSIIPVPLPMIDHTRHLIMSNHHHNNPNTNPWANSSQILLQQLSSAAVAAAARSTQNGTQGNFNDHGHNLDGGVNNSAVNNINSMLQQQQQQQQNQQSSISTPNIMMLPSSASASSSSLNNQNSWRTPFVLDPSMGSSASLNNNSGIGNVQIKSEQFNYHLNNNNNSSNAFLNNNNVNSFGLNSGLSQQQQHQSRSNNMSTSSNSTAALSAAAAAAAATAAAAAMLYPIELGKKIFLFLTFAVL